MEQSNQIRVNRPIVIKRKSHHALGLSSTPPFAWLLLAVLGLSLLGSTASLAAWGLVIVWALRGPGHAVEALLTSMVLVFLNSAVFATDDQTLILRWIVLLVASARVAFSWARHRFWRPRWLAAYAIFVVYLLFHALLLSKFPSLSVFKALAFAVMALTAYIGIALGKRDWGRNMVAFGVIIAVLSVPLLVLPAGYIKNGSQFQGLLSHPQSFGVILAVPFAYMVALWALNKKSSLKPTQFVLLTIMAVMLFLSGARSGYFAAAIAILIMLLWRSANQPSRLIHNILFHPLTYFLLAGLILFVGLYDVSDHINTLIFERDPFAYTAYGVRLSENASFIERLFASRQHLASVSWKNFLARPWFGIGLGVPSNLLLPASASRISSFVVSAPVEKGFFGFALLEELGIAGALLFVVLTAVQFRIIFGSRQVAIVCLALSALLITVGEFIYFAPGGIGVLVHVGIGIGLAAGETPTTSPSPSEYERTGGANHETT